MSQSNEAGVGPLERPVGRPAPERDPRGMTTAELQAEIGRLQSELIRRVCGDPVQGIGLTVAGWHSVCNCNQHKRGESTGGWYCNAHGQQL